MAPVVSKAKQKNKLNRRGIEDLDGNHAREIEQKRNSGQISCAECRRLKIRCDKQIPCQSCQRRGCAALCPNGSLATGEGTRFVLAATEHLYRRIENMLERIQQLEDALSQLQAKHSTEVHPLLRADLIRSSQGDMDVPFQAEEPTFSDQPRELEDALGTMSITDEGTRFFGPTAGSHCLLMKDSPEDGLDSSTTDSTRDSKSPQLPPAISRQARSFPLSLGSSDSPVSHIIKWLPTWDRASYLIGVYLQGAAWLFQSVTREQVMNELLSDNYSNGVLTFIEPTNPHRLGLLFLIFAIGTLLDQKQGPEETEAELFHQCARAAVCLRSVMENPSLETLQVLHLLSVYNALSGNELAGKETTVETTWSLVPLAAHLSQAIGLHRDSSRWDLPPHTVQRRRLLFWDLFVADAWQSLDSGRPPTFCLSYVNCKFPDGSTPHEPREGDEQPTFDTWSVRFTAECVTQVALRTLSAEPPSYSSIMELDRKVREFRVPDAVTEFVATASGAGPPKHDKNMGPAQSMGRFFMSFAREIILLYLHRSYFAQALTESPANPMTTTYGPSFLAAYRASVTVLRTTIAQFSLYDVLVSRIWAVWTYILSASFVFGTIVTRGPRSPMASSAMKDLQDAWQLFSRGASLSRRAQKALPYVTKLRDKARNALIFAHSALPLQLGEKERTKDENEGLDDLTIFAGRSKFVSKRRPTEGTTSSSSSKPDGTGKQRSPNSDPSEHMPAPPSYESNDMSIGPGSWTYAAEVQPRLPEAPPRWEQPHYPYPPLQPAILPLPQHPQHPIQTEHSFLSHSTQPPLSVSLASTSNQYRSSGVPSASQHYLAQPSYERLAPVYYGDDGIRDSIAPPELTHMGLVAQQSRLDQRWTSFMRESGYFEG